MANLYDKAGIYGLFQNEEKYQAVKKHWEPYWKGRICIIRKRNANPGLPGL